MKVKLFALILLVVALSSLMLENALCLTIKTNKEIYQPNDSLIVFGSTEPGSSITIQVFNPEGSPVAVAQGEADAQGFFEILVMKFPPEPTDRFPQGIYTIKVYSLRENVEFLKSVSFLMHVENVTTVTVTGPTVTITTTTTLVSTTTKELPPVTETVTVTGPARTITKTIHRTEFVTGPTTTITKVVTQTVKLIETEFKTITETSERTVTATKVVETPGFYAGLTGILTVLTIAFLLTTLYFATKARKLS